MRRVIALAALAAVLLGCPYFQKPKADETRYNFQDEAGSVLVGVQSVAPFDAYVDALQPRFNLTPEDALRTAVATTQLQELRDLKALLLSIAVNLPTQTTSISKQLSRTNDQTTSSRTETTTEASGAVPTASVPEKLTDVISQLDDSSTSISFDASLNYRAAAALMQEVTLLSNYVRDAAVGAHATPYVVRMLLTVFPSARRSPYDVYTNISFFGNVGPESHTYEPRVYNRNVIVPFSGEAGLKKEIAECNGKPLQTIPLFVTDNLETSVLRSARGSAADVGGSLGGSVGAAGIGVGGRVQNESTAASLGRGVNALFTLGVASENTLAVRLGAVTYDNGYEMLPRTYNLTALVLVPSVSVSDIESVTPEALSIKDKKEREASYSKRQDLVKKLKESLLAPDDLILPCPFVAFRAQSKFRDAKYGSILPSRDKEGLKSELEDLGLRDEKFLAALLRDSYDDFAKAYREAALMQASNNLGEQTANPARSGGGNGHSSVATPILEDSPEYYWTAAVAARTRRGFAGGQFEVPRSIVKFFYKEDSEKVVIYDDGKSSYIQLSGAIGLVSKGLSGQLAVKNKDKLWTLYSTNAVATSDGTGARIEFPSIQQAAKAASLEIKDLEVGVSLRYSPPLQRWSPASLTYYSWAQDQSPIVAIDAKVTPVAFSLIPSASHIRANADGVGQIKFEVKPTDKKNPVPEIRFAVEGGVITSINPPENAGTGADIVLPTNKIYTVTISNLIPGNSLKLKAWRMDGESKVELPAIPIAVYQQEVAPSRGSKGE